MTKNLPANLAILPMAQQALWPHLRHIPDAGFILYGGTAIALRLGHRQSIDFDFFSDRSLDKADIIKAFPLAAKSTSLQDRDNTWVMLVSGSQEESVKVSFFGALDFGRVGEPELTQDGVLQVASLDDLMATKVKVILQRAEAKDYRDIAAMVNAGVSLSRGLASARLLFGPNFQASESLKALVYFNDGDLNTLTETEKNTLVNAVKSIVKLPSVNLRSSRLSDML
ncbi:MULTISPECIES: nucleotidyl transferase AbiEii/AbiGii toxin family protein [unclassified Undibacterium]|uniref:nucleotidyl transferase AbiEii/AbiGii toxin family protein n=1 Tax=unclassified Undibacterium TaxID=2630295 RepID=UPI002AC91BB2|nr:MULTISPECIES: nucleotidyl transferase AbiEii/AbiGii toxin family protein [unclassified Undibacterium]MEB0140997.1 nucleotidyl transferase AbiEii/AbiGii toxin family protein [Undibacterium sp. CCC2.1]MEB0173997.1 nucleotidyl transferase AbiEii/AbiGii toxin family protein [Undibacterium sp. CCC1.1]MEB0177919.1 nucleotidyl transferase AbiEii/AbiGii toxin family protein [Undibacterium sp. CCC3.4]MEB0217197.1 nucleotidyl transferase AbiEii/AbiGii toxin family protein [Undibacterium sp. 5I2]WPX42